MTVTVIHIVPAADIKGGEKLRVRVAFDTDEDCVAKWEGDKLFAVRLNQPKQGADEKVHEADRATHERVSVYRPLVPGTPATYHIGSDSYPYTVRSVSRSGHQVIATADKTTAPGVHVGDANAELEVFTRRKDGRYRPAKAPCGWLSFGTRERDLDPSF